MFDQRNQQVGTQYNSGIGSNLYSVVLVAICNNQCVLQNIFYSFDDINKALAFGVRRAKEFFPDHNHRDRKVKVTHIASEAYKLEWIEDGSVT